MGSVAELLCWAPDPSANVRKGGRRAPAEEDFLTDEELDAWAELRAQQRGPKRENPQQKDVIKGLLRNTGKLQDLALNRKRRVRKVRAHHARNHAR